MLHFDTTQEGPPPRDAATVVLLREPPTGLEVFLLERHASSRFLRGASVFPGGAVDEEDRSERWRTRTPAEAVARASERLDPSGAQESALPFYVAAVRETLEEAGVLLVERGLDAASTAALRARRAEGVPFVELLDEAGLTLDLDALRPHARWVTPAAERRRYDTRFFVALVAADVHASPDGAETVSGRWLRPADALALEAQGALQLAPPTLRTIELLLSASGAHEFLEQRCQRAPPIAVTPVFREIDGKPTLLFPGDAEHPERDPVLPGPTRMVLDRGRWVGAVGSR